MVKPAKCFALMLALRKSSVFLFIAWHFLSVHYSDRSSRLVDIDQVVPALV